ncbi:MAG: hypothetical protein QF492_03730 [Candidatus Krumholzibacteria bacterium]|jgi:nitrogen regulatory protein PII|nr:hypothetical protein [Candidatus Krumholzibacteria bacterium]MDP6669007.1 hypothetical protein [Candidatus Krumholzibacteria bacterium]MDP6796711.1 hypothetical protein [Candidatus Krumholzibacteria bacterium]MDP7021725.1 hypothetical protein [Candidatus Krumholzibacteria bacterium]
MVMLVIILPQSDVLEDILEAFLEVGVTGSTVLDARGMGQILSEEIPIFAGIRGLFPGRESQHSLLLSVVEEEKADAILKMLPEICGPLSRKGSGIAFTVPVDRVQGMAKEL